MLVDLFDFFNALLALLRLQVSWELRDCMRRRVLLLFFGPLDSELEEFESQLRRARFRWQPL